MKKKELEEKTEVYITETRAALQLVYDSLNKGQQKKLLKNASISALFAKHKIDTGDN